MDRKIQNLFKITKIELIYSNQNVQIEVESGNKITASVLGGVPVVGNTRARAPYEILRVIVGAYVVCAYT